MANENAIALASAILQRTKEREIDWEEDPFYNGYYIRLGHGKCLVHVDDDNDVFFSIYNDNDTLIERLDEKQLRDSFVFPASDLWELFHHAKRVALKTDEIIENMLMEIKSIIPF